MTQVQPVQAAVRGPSLVADAPVTQGGPAGWGIGSAGALLLGLSGAVALRIGVGGTDGVRDPWAGLAFAAVLALLCLAAAQSASGSAREPGCRTSRVRLYRRTADPVPEMSSHEGGLEVQSRTRDVGGRLLVGVAGAGVLCVVPLVVHLRTPAGALDPSDFGVWALVVTAVAVAEEAFLRGALWTAVARGRGGETAALLVSTVAFGLLHVPFYGPDALPLDLAVGLLLGGLRQLTGGWAAPAVAHTIADLAGWWLR